MNKTESKSFFIEGKSTAVTYGAGKQVNGVFEQVGEENGKAKLKLKGKECWIQWSKTCSGTFSDEAWKKQGSRWAWWLTFNTGGKDNTKFVSAYSNEQDTAYPPQTGWKKGSGGTDPVVKLKYRDLEYSQLKNVAPKVIGRYNLDEFSGKVCKVDNNLDGVSVTAEGYGAKALRFNVKKDMFVQIHEGQMFYVGTKVQNLAVSTKGGYSGYKKRGDVFYLNAHCMDKSYGTPRGKAEVTGLCVKVSTSGYSQDKFWEFMQVAYVQT